MKGSLWHKDKLACPSWINVKIEGNYQIIFTRHFVPNNGTRWLWMVAFWTYLSILRQNNNFEQNFRSLKRLNDKGAADRSLRIHTKTVNLNITNVHYTTKWF